MFAYIDPGTGSMLFSILIGIATASVFLFRSLVVKLGVLLHGKSGEKDLKKYGYVIFSDSKRYWNIFKPICDEFEKRKIALEYWTMSEDDPALKEKYTFVHAAFIGEGNTAFAKLNMMKADVCLSTTPGLDVYQWKRSKNTGCYVHVTHDICAVTGYRMFGLDYYDSVLIPGAHLEKELRMIEDLRGIPHKDVRVVGSTYMDGLREKEKNSKPEKHEGINVLVAPSWGESSILNKFGSSFLRGLTDAGFHIIVRPHPQSLINDKEMIERLQKEFPESKNFEWNFDTDNFNVLSRSDIMISDFSGVIFDFVFTFGRPVIYANTEIDLAPYDDAWLEEKTWRLRVLPELGRQLQESEFNHIGSIIKEMISDNSYKGKIAEISDYTWQYKGEAAVRIVDYLVEKRGQLNG